MLRMFGEAWTHASMDVLPVRASAVVCLPLCRQMLNRKGEVGISACNVFELLQHASVCLEVCRHVFTSPCVSPCPGVGQLHTWTDSPAVKQHMDLLRVDIMFMGQRVGGWRAVGPPNRKSCRPTLSMWSRFLQCININYQALFHLLDNFPRHVQHSGSSSSNDVRFFLMPPHRRVFVFIPALGVYTAGPCLAPLTPQWGFMPPRFPSPSGLHRASLLSGTGIHRGHRGTEMPTHFMAWTLSRSISLCL